MKFRKKPIVIEAWQYNTREIAPKWLTDRIATGELRGVPGGVEVKTLHGPVLAKPGDWIVRSVKGDIYPCAPDVFAATYEPVTEPALPMVAEIGNEVLTVNRAGTVVRL